MTGVHHIEVKNRDAVFKFDLYRNITIVRGDSGAGKTTLFDMIADYTRFHEASGRYHSFKKMFKSDSNHIYYKDKATGKLDFDTLG